MQRTGPERHIEAAKRRLAHLGGLAARTHEAEQSILAAAEERERAIDAELAKLRPRALLDDDAARRVEELTAERGHLHTIAAKSRAAGA